MPRMQACIICQTMPFKDNFDIIHGTLEFTATGNYGSTVYDPIDARTHLRVNICDECVRTAATRGLVQETTVIPRPDELRHRRWEAEE